MGLSIPFQIEGMGGGGEAFGGRRADQNSDPEAAASAALTEEPAFGSTTMSLQSKVLHYATFSPASPHYSLSLYGLVQYLKTLLGKKKKKKNVSRHSEAAS